MQKPIIISDRTTRYKTTRIKAGRELSTIMITAQARPTALIETGELCLDICDARHAIAAQTIIDINGKVTADGIDYSNVTCRGRAVPLQAVKCNFYIERACDTTYEEDRGLRGIFCPAEGDLPGEILLNSSQQATLKRIDLFENGGLLTVADFRLPAVLPLPQL